MEQKIQELTDKIYKEGVEKGEVKAKEVVAAAEAKAAQIVKDAEAKAEQTAADAKKKADDLLRNTASEIKMAGEKAIEQIKGEIVKVVTAQVIGGASTKALSDPATLKEFVSVALSNWKASSGDTPKLEVLLPATKQEELKQSFAAGASAALDGAEIRFSKDIKAGFRIGPAGGSFKISFSDEDFTEFFKEYLRKETRAYLFGE